MSFKVILQARTNKRPASAQDLLSAFRDFFASSTRPESQAQIVIKPLLRKQRYNFLIYSLPCYTNFLSLLNFINLLQFGLIAFLLDKAKRLVVEINK